METPSKIPSNLENLLDLPIRLTVEIGSCQLPMRDVLQLAPGSVIQLEKNAEDTVDLFVNQKRIAAGEVVIIEDRLGVKVTEILKQPQP